MSAWPLQVVPDCQSRSALGETCDGGLREIFARDFGPPGSDGFETARTNFLRSEAGYGTFAITRAQSMRCTGLQMLNRATLCSIASANPPVVCKGRLCTAALPRCPCVVQRLMQRVDACRRYAIACYLLNIKDRHNGNIMIDKVMLIIATPPAPSALASVHQHLSMHMHWHLPDLGLRA